MADESTYNRILAASGYVPPPEIEQDTPGPTMARILSAGGDPRWTDPNIPAEQRLGGFLKTHAANTPTEGGPDEKRVFGRPYSYNAESESKAEADVLVKAKRLFPGVDENAVKQQFQLERAHQRQSKQGEDTTEFLAREAMPFMSSIGNAQRAKMYGRAIQAFNERKATPDDMEVIARYERLNNIDKNESTGASLKRGLTNIVPMLGEAYLAGPLGPASRGYKALGLVKAGAKGEAVLTPGLFQAGARTGIQTAAMPSMYLKQGAENQLANPDESTFQSYAPAYGLGLAQTAVLGQLSNRFGNVPTMAGRLGARTGLGLAEQQGLDVAGTGLDRVSKAVTGYGLGLDTKWGTGAALYRGDDDSLKHAFVQTMTFAAFAGMHGQDPQAIFDGFKRVVNGRSLRSREAVGKDLIDAVKPIQDHLAENKMPDPEVLKKIVEDTPVEHRPYVEAIVESLPVDAWANENTVGSRDVPPELGGMLKQPGQPELPGKIAAEIAAHAERHGQVPKVETGAENGTSQIGSVADLNPETPISSKTAPPVAPAESRPSVQSSGDRPAEAKNQPGERRLGIRERIEAARAQKLPAEGVSVELPGAKRVPVVETPVVADPEKAFDAAVAKAGLDPHETHVLRERLKPEARSHEKIAGDFEMRKANNEVYTRQQVSNIEKRAREKMVAAGVELPGFTGKKSVAAGVHAEDAAQNEAARAERQEALRGDASRAKDKSMIGEVADGFRVDVESIPADKIAEVDAHGRYAEKANLRYAKRLAKLEATYNKARRNAKLKGREVSQKVTDRFRERAKRILGVEDTPASDAGGANPDVPQETPAQPQEAKPVAADVKLLAARIKEAHRQIAEHWSNVSVADSRELTRQFEALPKAKQREVTRAVGEDVHAGLNSLHNTLGSMESNIPALHANKSKYDVLGFMPEEEMPKELQSPTRINGESDWSYEERDRNSRPGMKTVAQDIYEGGGINPDTVGKGEAQGMIESGMGKLFKDGRKVNDPNKRNMKGVQAWDEVAMHYADLGDPNETNHENRLLDMLEKHRVLNDSGKWDELQAKREDFRHEQELKAQGKSVEHTSAEVNPDAESLETEYGSHEFDAHSLDIGFSIIPEAPNARGGVSYQPSMFNPGDANPLKGREFATARAEVTKEREELGLPPVAAAFKVKNRASWDEAMERLRVDPTAAAKLVNELEAKPRAINVVETALLLQRRIALSNEYNHVAADFNREVIRNGKFEKEASPAQLEAIGRRMDDVLNQRVRLDEITSKAGTETARGLQFFAQLARDDFNLTSMIAQAQRAKGKPLTEAERNEITALNAKIEELQKKLDAAEKGKGSKEGGPEKKGEVGDKTDVEIEVKKTKRKFQEQLEGFKRAQRSTARKVYDTGVETFNALRAIQTSYDLSATLRQGAFLSAAHPIKAAQAFAESLRSAFSLRSFDRAQEAILNRENALNGTYKDSGLYIADINGHPTAQEEAFIGRWVKRIPGIRQSERAYTAYLNRIRADVFDAMAKSLPRDGKSTPMEAKAIANFVNVATGRGKLPGSFDKAAAGLAQVFFSPRYLASRFQVLAGQPFYSGTGRTRGKIAMEYARFGIGMAAFYSLMKMANDDAEINFDPRSSDFGKVKIKQFRLDPLAGLAQIATLGGRTTTGETKSSDTGRVTALRGPNKEFGGTTMMDVFGRFGRSKLAPVPGFAVTAATGEDAIGKPATWSESGQNLVEPMIIEDVRHALKAEGVPRGVMLSALAILGQGTQLHEPREKITPAQRKLSAANNEGMLPLMYKSDLTPRKLQPVLKK